MPISYSSRCRVSSRSPQSVMKESRLAVAVKVRASSSEARDRWKSACDADAWRMRCCLRRVEATISGRRRATSPRICTEVRKSATDCADSSIPSAAWRRPLALLGTLPARPFLSKPFLYSVLFLVVALFVCSIVTLSPVCLSSVHSIFSPGTPLLVHEISLRL